MPEPLALPVEPVVPASPAGLANQVVPERDQVAQGPAPEQGQVVARGVDAAARAAVAGPAAAVVVVQGVAAAVAAVAAVVVRAVVVAVAGVSHRLQRARSVRCPPGGQPTPIGRRGQMGQ